MTAQQALAEVCALLSTTEGDVRQQIKAIFDLVPDAEKPELEKHPLYRKLAKREG